MSPPAHADRASIVAPGRAAPSAARWGQALLAGLMVVVGVADGRADRADPGARVASPPVLDLDRARRDAAAAPAEALEARLRSPVRAVSLAAIAAADASPDRAGLLAELAVAAGGWDRSLAAPAARAARVIARGLIGDEVAAGGGPAGLPPGEVVELDDDELARAIDAWRAVAGRADRWADVRVAALEIVVALVAVRRELAAGPVTADDLTAFTGDADPEVRRAAIELTPVPAPVGARAGLVGRLVGDPVVAVRLAAAQALCADLPRDAAAVLTALGDDGRAAVRALVAPAATDTALVVAPPGAAAIDAARCLAADDDPASRQALEALRHRLPRGLRATLAAVIADVAARASPTR